MFVAVASYLTSLDYTYPVYDNTVEADPTIPKDILLAQTLRLDRLGPIPQPKKNSAPLNSTINPIGLSSLDNPLQELLNASREKVNNYSEAAQKFAFRTNPIPPPIKTDFSKQENERRGSNRSTPISNKTIFFSPAGKGKRSITPLAKRKSSMNLKQKLLKMDLASLISLTKQQQPSQLWAPNEAAPKEDRKEEDADISDYDFLACHADNIMRMAVDSTMLGSTFNSSFSSSFSNSFTAENSGKDFFDKEAKKSILEGLNF